MVNEDDIPELVDSAFDDKTDLDLAFDDPDTNLKKVPLTIITGTGKFTH